MENRLQTWEAQLQAQTFPEWHELPDLELYMDQVVLFLSRHLAFLSHGTEEEKIITPSIINNYVRLKIMPAPVKKRYSRIHIAYLLMICTLKQSLSMATIQKLIPSPLEEEQIRMMYTDFIALFRTAASAFSHQAKDASLSVLPATLGIWACLAKSLTDYLLEE